MRVVLLGMLALLLAACGIRKPLIAPKDIPAFEEKQRKKRERLQDPNATETDEPTPSSPDAVSASGLDENAAPTEQR